MTADPLLIFARAMQFAALFSLFGSALFSFYAPEATAFLRGGLAKILRLGALIAVPSGLLGLALMAAAMAGGFREVFALDFAKVVFLDTPFGAPVAARLSLLLGLTAFALWPGEGAQWRGVGLGLGAGLLIDQAWLGHAAQGFGLSGAIMLAVYSLHVLAGAAWLGALAPLLLLASRETDQGFSLSPRGFSLSQKIFGRFSRLATPIVLLVLATGAQNLSFRLGWRPSPFWGAEYGVILAVKFLFVALALALAVFNRAIAVPALARGAGGRALKASLVAEITLALAIVTAAAALGVTPPP